MDSKKLLPQICSILLIYSLTQLLQKVDQVPTSGSDDLRHIRKGAVDQIHRLIERLEGNKVTYATYPHVNYEFCISQLFYSTGGAQ